MSTNGPNPTLRLTTISRTVASLAVGVVDTLERAMVGDGRTRTARGNAWEAVCADRARAVRQEELRRLVSQLSVGSSPRSSASQAAVGPSAGRRAARS
jgi:hypothetical protein